MEEVAQSENVIVLENGEIAMQGTPMDIFKQEDKMCIRDRSVILTLCDI